MSPIRRQLIRRIQRESGRNVREIVRGCRGLTALEIARRFLVPATAAASVPVAVRH
jgi:hypothetical protein